MKGNAVIVADSLEAGIRLEKIIAREAQFRVVARFISPVTLLEAATAQAQKPVCEWDLVLMVLSAAEWNGVDAGRRLREILPEVPILLFTVLSSSDDEAAEPVTLSEGEEELTLQPAAREMLRRINSLATTPRPAEAPPKRNHSTFEFFSRLIRRKRS
ncbi:MAG TPA: hypothetical protein VFW45_06735 [Candidatus Polarisedimenticolia bacterium]|nr:hypothetical protein [Candidatus Polarisedimenticolia bacterium]